MKNFITTLKENRDWVLIIMGSILIVFAVLNLFNNDIDAMIARLNLNEPVDQEGFAPIFVPKPSNDESLVVEQPVSPDDLISADGLCPGMAPPIQALCLAPFGMEEGSDADAPAQEFGLVVGEPVRFRFFGSSVRRQDQAGTLLDFWAPDELQELEEIEATLPADTRRAGDIVRVRLHARVTETGTLELEALPVDGSERWKVEFDTRGEAGDG